MLSEIIDFTVYDLHGDSLVICQA